MSTPRILPEIIEVIVDQIGDFEQDTVKACSLISTAFVGPSQRRLFHYLHLRDTEAMPKFECDGNVISPDRARDFFASSPHLASYVRELAISIPSRRIQNRFRGLSIGRFSEHEPKEDLYIAFQTVLPAFTRVKQLTLSGPHDCSWTSLPEPFTSAVYAVLGLPTLGRLRVFGLTIPASLITVISASVRELSLSSTTTVELGDPTRALTPGPGPRILSPFGLSSSMIALSACGALPHVRELSIGRSESWTDICKLLQAHTWTLTHFHCDLTAIASRDRLSTFFSLPHMHALRVLELRTTADLEESEYGQPRLTTARASLDSRFASLISELPSKTPVLERAIFRVDLLALETEVVWVPGAIPQIPEVEEEEERRSRLKDVHWYLHSLESDEHRGRRKFDAFVPFIQEQMSIRSDLGMITFWHLLGGKLVEKRIVES
ncbi:hypothetical protein FB45DRAFT_1053259 [Roridomyces roridus]|uniref:Uncharacterized protein n=1 Tax=Roridomyces roridus TaxID=1738132 RepID=A0AAD7CBW8_9AGAR|nr:hypothetical protein FB45DRAFT_1053259 [Roridomyces roridus]